MPLRKFTVNALRPIDKDELTRVKIHNLILRVLNPCAFNFATSSLASSDCKANMIHANFWLGRGYAHPAKGPISINPG